MTMKNINPGETFQLSGEHYEKTKDGIKRLSDNQYVDLKDDDSSEVIMERRLING